MKKQILFLAFFVLAMMAGTLTSFGQTTHLDASTATVTPLSCATASTDGLHPFAGVPYTYTLIGDAGTVAAADYTWWVTKDKDFVTDVVTPATMAGTNFGTKLGSPDILNESATYGTTTTTATGNAVTFTWGADVLAGTSYQGQTAPGTPTFVVGYSTGTGCADNIQVYEIDPKPSFTVSILPIDPANTTTFLWQDNTGDAKECVDVVHSAKYNAGTFMIDMDYGTNTFYYEVGAANFVKDWTPTFRITGGLRTTQTAVIEMYPTLADATAGNNVIFTSAAIDEAGMNADITTGKQLDASTPADGTTGVSVFVKVVITNLTEESLTDNDFVLAVDAQDNSEAGNWDMTDADCTGAAPFAKDQADFATIMITPRPQLDAGTTSPTAPTKTIPKPSTSGAADF